MDLAGMQALDDATFTAALKNALKTGLGCKVRCIVPCDAAERLPNFLHARLCSQPTLVIDVVSDPN